MEGWKGSRDGEWKCGRGEAVVAEMVEEWNV